MIAIYSPPNDITVFSFNIDIEFLLSLTDSFIYVVGLLKIEFTIPGLFNEDILSLKEDI